MDNQTRALIQTRAERLFPILRDELTLDHAAYELGETYKFVYLVLRRPRAYLGAFREGTLKIDMEAVADIFWSSRLEIPGPDGLMHEEREMIGEHNRAVDDWIGDRSPAHLIGAREHRVFSARDNPLRLG